MKRFKYMSDLHGYGLDFKSPEDKESIALVAGDVVTSFGKGARIWNILTNLCAQFEQVIMVPGNHEYYDTSLLRLNDKIKEVTSDLKNFTLLDNESVVVDDILIIGSTMWSDVSGSEYEVRIGMNDYHYIRTGSKADPYKRRLHPRDTLELHYEALEFIRSELNNWDGDSIVLSHHAPSSKSVAPRYEGHELNCAFVTDISLSKWPNYWVHGHVHTNFNYIHEGCNILCNPGGYRGEVTGFDQVNNYFYL